MAVTKKVLRKVAAKLESSYGVYVAPDVLLPFTSATPKQGFSMIPDESIVGIAFKGLPAQGVRKLDGSIEMQADLNTLPVILEAAFGTNSTGVFTCPATSNNKSLSICGLDGVKTNKYTSCFLNNFAFKSEAEGGVMVSADVLSAIAETRDDTDFPTINTTAGTRILHQHCASSGYFRIGDQSDALAAGDNRTDLKALNFGINWGFALDYANGQGALQPQSVAGEATLSFTIAEHTSDAFMAWRDARTVLQLSALYYLSATKTMLIEIPNFVITECVISGDDKAKQEVACAVARNGISTAYENANMTFNSPVRVTIVNS